jgi:hypothetical protein
VDDSTITVRMYNVGFGDCFLLFVPVIETNGGRRIAKVLIDCGVRANSPKPNPLFDVASQIARDVEDPAGEAHIDVVIATHRHQDHVEGFRYALWGDVKVDEVWLPWTEDPDDPEAVAILRRQSSLAQAIRTNLNLLSATGVDAERRELMAALAENALSNSDAMKTLHHGFAGKPTRRFLSRSTYVRRPRQLPGVRVHVLGPSRSPEVIQDMNPPSGESYVRLAGGSPSGPSETLFEEAAVTEDRVIAGAVPGFQPDIRQAKGQLRAMTSDGLILSAVALESAVNNTSLMLMFEIGDAYLLFPGDAQWGTWALTLEDQRTRRLLERTTFYKIGHHGSHNATPRQYVDGPFPADGWAVASVAKIPQWKYIPKAELLTALEEKSGRPGRVFTSMDSLTAPPPEVDTTPKMAVDIRLPI